MHAFRALANKGVFLAFTVACASPLAMGCRSSHASEPQVPEHTGEVSMTAAEMKAAEVGTAAVADQRLDGTLVTSGRVTFDDLKVAHVSSPVSGRVTRIDARPGQHVKRGDVLAVIQSFEIGTAASDLGKAEADFIAAGHDFSREKELMARSATSRREVEQSEDAYRKASAELERARTKARLLRTSGVNTAAGTYTLTAPIDGEVISRSVSPGVEVQGQYSGGTAIELFTIGQLDVVWVMADLYEVDIERVKVGNAITMKVVAFKDKTFTGKIDWVSGTLDPQTRTAKVRCVLDNPGMALKPEMYATVNISVEGRNALAIPRSSIVKLGDQTVVFVEAARTPDGSVKFERTPVMVDDVVLGDAIPVLHGLERGQVVATKGADALALKL